jgi:hypothetical protein
MEENSFCGPLSYPAVRQLKSSLRTPYKEVHTIDASTTREWRIELASSAALTEVSSKATVYIFGVQGYEKVREGTTRFSCFIWRSFRETMQVSAAPVCFDAQGSRTLMLAAMHREELRAQGKSEAEIKDDITKGYKDGRFKARRPGFLYMMSNENYFYDPDDKQWGTVPPHVMFYAPNKPRKTRDTNRDRPQGCLILTETGRKH